MQYFRILCITRLSLSETHIHRAHTPLLRCCALGFCDFEQGAQGGWFKSRIKMHAYAQNPRTGANTPQTWFLHHPFSTHPFGFRPAYASSANIICRKPMGFSPFDALTRRAGCVPLNLTRETLPAHAHESAILIQWVCALCTCFIWEQRCTRCVLCACARCPHIIRVYTWWCYCLLLMLCLHWTCSFDQVFWTFRAGCGRVW